MDPISALGIAAAVVQFLDFGAKLVGTSLEVYRSVEGATEENLNTEYLAEYTRDLSARLSGAQHLNGGKALSHYEAKLVSLAKKSRGLANELTGLLITLRNRGAHNSWAAIRQAIRLKGSENEIMSLKTRLDATKAELSLQLLCMMSNGQSALSAAMHNIDQRCRNLELRSLETLTQIQDSAAENMKALNLVLEQVDQHHKPNSQPNMPSGTEIAGVIWMLNAACDQPRAKVAECRKALLGKLAKAQLHNAPATSILAAQKDDYDSIVSAVAPACMEFVGRYLSAIGDYVCELDPLTKQLPILGTLRVEDMLQREANITEAFTMTYAWIADPQVSPLARWLENGAGTFWISGKPGSGKSTLLKFVTHQAETKLLLERWANGRSLTVSKHFFWGTGTALQKSHLGLLQNLVFQILRDRSDLIKRACPERWANVDVLARDLQPEPWTESELKETLQSALEGQEDTAAFCIFIDGLDEFVEDHFALITEIIQLHARKPNVKFCVSSRPYNVFSKAFGQDDTRTFALQDMNARDIDIFVQGRLERDERYCDLARRDPGATELALEIRRRAEGVFLWVHLVVWELLKGLSEDDDIRTLQARLDLLPKSLEAFFAHMLNSVDEIYRKHTARSLLLAHRAREPLPVMAYAFLYEDDRSSSFLANIAVTPMTRTEINEKRLAIEKKMSSWCKGLMEVRIYSTANVWEPLRKYRVDFLHRSVKDYLETSDMQQFLGEKAGFDFHAERMLASLFVAQAKVVDVQEGMSDEMTAFDFMAEEANYYAKLHDIATRDHLRTLSRQIAVELEQTRQQMEEQRSLPKLPDTLLLPPPPASPMQRCSVSRDGRRSLFSRFIPTSLSKKR